jgi:asparagine synthase (glutamine-hydrolysing)
LRDRLRSAVEGEALAATGMFDPATLRHLVDAHLAGRRDYSTPLWTLLMFDAFLRNEGGGELSRPLRQATG